jgi:hypothetical protein
MEQRNEDGRHTLRLTENARNLNPRNASGVLGRHTGQPQRGIDPYGKLRLESKLLGRESVAFLDPALGVPAVLAHVPFAGRAISTGHGIWSADDASHEVADCESRSVRASSTRPSDSCPITSRSCPGGAQPYRPATMSTSVPQTPMAMVSIGSPPWAKGGKGTSSSRTEPDTPGVTVRARTSNIEPITFRLRETGAHGDSRGCAHQHGSTGKGEERRCPCSRRPQLIPASGAPNTSRGHRSSPRGAC